MITEVAFVGTPVKDMARARAFYEGALGLKPSLPGEAFVEYDLGGTTFAIGCYGDVWKPMPDGVIVAFEVDDLPAEVARLKTLGVKIKMDVTESPVCHLAIVEDPDGTAVMLHKRKTK